jgi:hypothetical protein
LVDDISLVDDIFSIKLLIFFSKYGLISSEGWNFLLGSIIFVSFLSFRDTGYGKGSLSTISIPIISSYGCDLYRNVLEIYLVFPLLGYPCVISIKLLFNICCFKIVFRSAFSASCCAKRSFFWMFCSKNSFHLCLISCSLARKPIP